MTHVLVLAVLGLPHLDRHADPHTLARLHSFGVGLNSNFDSAFSPNGLWLMIGGYSGRLTLWDIPTGQRMARWEGHRDDISSLPFVGPGRVPTASRDLTALVGDLRPRRQPIKPVWDALSGLDAEDASRAVWSLAADPKAPERLRSWVRNAAPPPPEKV
jgi:WD40 repeat protein